MTVQALFDKSSVYSRDDAFAHVRQHLRGARLDCADIDARALVLAALEISWAELIADGAQPVPGAAVDRLRTMVARRINREPLAYILGAREFWGHRFKVDASTLIPRPDSEVIVETALAGLAEMRAAARAADEAYPVFSVLDLGTGSGALLLSVLAESPDIVGLGVDLNVQAVRVAQENAQALGMAARCDFVCTSWMDGLSAADVENLLKPCFSAAFSAVPQTSGAVAPWRGFDLVIANPPYIPRLEVDKLATDVSKFEPRLALDGGSDGLDCYRQLAPVIARWLRPGGYFVVEHGFSQQKDVANLLFANPELRFSTDLKDLAGRDRGLSGYRDFSR